MTNQATINLVGVSARGESSFFQKTIRVSIKNTDVIDKLSIMSKAYGISQEKIVNDILEAYCFPDDVKYMGIKKG